MLHLTTQEHGYVDALVAALTTGTLTAMQALTGIAQVRQRGQGALADVLKATVQTWHAAYAQRMQGPQR